MEFTQLPCLSNNQANKSNPSKPSSTGLWQSIAIHTFVLIVLLQTSLSNNHLTNNISKGIQQTTHPLIKPIKASLFYTKQLVQSDKPCEERTIEDAISTTSSPAPATNKQESVQTLKNAFTVDESSKSIIAKDKLAEQQAENSKSTLNNKSPANTKHQFDAFSSLAKLSQQQDSYAMNASMNDHNQQREKDKNTIKKSINLYGKVPEAKAKKLEVNCQNAMLKGLSILGGLMGGSIKCNSYNGADKYINARLKKMKNMKEISK